MKAPIARFELSFVFFLCIPALARAGGFGTCQDPQFCIDPCRAEGACFTDADCSGDQICGPPPPGVCVPSTCACSPVDHLWTCTNDCNFVCQVPVPAASAWGLLVLGILTLVVGSIFLRKRPTHLGTKVLRYCVAGFLVLLSSADVLAEVVRVDVADVAAFEELNLTPCAHVDYGNFAIAELDASDLVVLQSSGVAYQSSGLGYRPARCASEG